MFASNNWFPEKPLSVIRQIFSPHQLLGQTSPTIGRASKIPRPTIGLDSTNNWASISVLIETTAPTIGHFNNLGQAKMYGACFWSTTQGVGGCNLYRPADIDRTHNRPYTAAILSMGGF